MEGQRLGSYVLQRKLGEGGMGVVYVAVHAQLGQEVAVKLLLPEVSKNAEMLARFVNEARAASLIIHPSIVRVLDFGQTPDGSAYIVMELLTGESLAARLRRGPPPIAKACLIARQVANALAVAHQVGIVHRDLKPDNIFLVPDPEVGGGERAKILDFGIAKLTTDTVSANRTRTGMLLGTPYYMSPEQARGARDIDGRSDVYALGCILYEMLTGKPPFDGEGPGEVLGQHLFVEPAAVRARAPAVPPDLEAVVMRALAKELPARYQSMTELAAALAPFALPSAVSAPGSPAGLPAGATPAPTVRVRRGRRSLWIALAGVAAAAAVAVAVVVAGGGGSRSAAPADLAPPAVAVHAVPPQAAQPAPKEPDPAVAPAVRAHDTPVAVAAVTREAATPGAAPSPSMPPPADPGFGDVAFKTFESDGTTVVFTSDVKARVTWHNMVGGPVTGTYTQSGKNLEIKWDVATATHYGTKSEKYKQMGPCSMARYERIDLKDKLHDNSPEIYQQIAPRCDTVRLTK